MIPLTSGKNHCSFLSLIIIYHAVVGVVFAQVDYPQAVVMLEPPPPEAMEPPNLIPRVVHAALPVNEETVGDLFLVDETIDQVLDVLAAISGKKVLAAANMPQVFVNFDSQGPMSKVEAISAIETLLNLNGVSIADMGDGFLRAVPNQIIKQKSPPVIYHSAALLPPSEKVYKKLFKVQYMNWEEVTGVANNMITQGVGVVELFPTSNSLLITDSLINLQQFESLLEQLDTPTQQALIVKKLTYIEANTLKQILDEQLPNTAIRGVYSITADERANQIVIITDPNNRDLFASLIRTYDVDARPLTDSKVINLMHADAKEVATLLEGIISGQQSLSDEFPKPEIQNGNETALPTPARSSLNTNEPQGKTLQFSEYVAVIADERTNSIVVYGTDTDIEYVEKILLQIDVVLAQVRIDVVITEVTLTNDETRGIERFGISYDENDEIRFSLNQDSELPFSLEGSVTELLLNSLTVTEFTLENVFNTAKTDSNVTVLSAPTLVTTHNKEAVINAGESRPVITATNTDSTGLNTRSQIQFRDIGIQLKVKPLIGNNGIIQLEIEQTVESVVDEVLIDGNSQPVIGKREAISYLTVSNGDMVVLGGLQEKTIRKVGGKMVFFGDIPWLGDWLFSSKRDREINRELIIFLKPTVFLSPLDAKKDSETAIQKQSRHPYVGDFLESLDHSTNQQQNQNINAGKSSDQEAEIHINLEEQMREQMDHYRRRGF